jgi:hypothetical protein
LIALLVGCLPVYASGSVLARASIRLAQPIDVDMMASVVNAACGIPHASFAIPLEVR